MSMVLSPLCSALSLQLIGSMQCITFLRSLKKWAPIAKCRVKNPMKIYSIQSLWIVFLIFPVLYILPFLREGGTNEFAASNLSLLSLLYSALCLVGGKWMVGWMSGRSRRWLDRHSSKRVGGNKRDSKLSLRDKTQFLCEWIHAQCNYVVANWLYS